MTKKVLLGFSGGVDSSCAALILKNEGYEVHGLYFDVLAGGDVDARQRAEMTADAIGISLRTVNVSERFEGQVIRPFCKAYSEGKTPNPCIICNPALKFAVLKENADMIDAEYIATGHYANIQRLNNFYYVTKAVNLNKDQSYMLCRLDQDILMRLLLPLGTFESKDQIREMARSFSLPNSETKDSQDICFLPDDDYKSFLREKGIAAKSGNFVSEDGTVYGPHCGHYCYTIGQRKGLGIALGKPAFVTGILSNGDVLLGSNEDLFRKNVYIENMHYCGLEAVKGGRFTAKLRYTKNEAECFLEPVADNCAILMFRDAQRAPTPGQEAVLYKEGRIVACGTISETGD